jgi:Rrf2 family protein
MQITQATEYAVRCVLYLALQDQGRVVPRREVAEAMSIPGHFLGKIAQRLARGGVLQILQGVRGGYRLVVPPADLPLLTVVEAAEGDLCLNKCVMHPRVCSRSCSCSVHRVWIRARQALRETLRGVTLADLAAEERACAAPPAPPRRAVSVPCTTERR